MHSIALMDIELLNFISTKYTEKACSWVLILRLYDVFLRLPCVTRPARYAFFGRVFFNYYSLYFYTL